jgi:hypothetical protein
MSTAARRAFVLLLAVSCASCAKRTAGPKPPEPLHGDAVWFADGVAGDDASLEESLVRFRCAAVFLPVRRIAASGAAWSGSDAPAPPLPFSRIPVVLVLGADSDPLAGVPEERHKKFGAFLAREMSAALSRGAAFGPVRGVHLDFPFSIATAGAHATALREARSLLSHDLSRRPNAAPSPAGEIPVSWSLRQPPPAGEKQRETLRALVSRTDGLVAFVFGGDDSADPALTDSLGKLWWAGYSPSGSGVIRKASGESGGRVDESALETLTNDPRMEFLQELPWNQGRGWEFSFRARRKVAAGGGTLDPGDSVAFALPSLSDMVARFPEDRAGRRFNRGRVVVFRGHSDARRLFSSAALEDVIAGRPTVPGLRLWIEPAGGRLLRLQCENPTPHASVVSRVQNWVEVDLSPARIGDLETGGFERWEAYDGSGRPVCPGRASRVRLFETLVAPRERFEPARLTVRGNLPSPCCRVRTHLAAATGGEVVTDWALPAENPENPK